MRNQAAATVSFQEAHLLVKQGKLLINGELIKSCLIAAAEDCPEKINSLKTLSLSARIVVQRTENIGSSINSKFKDKTDDFKWFFLGSG